ncbi:hypothetical protein H181DRAFT_00810 [Streptomyces sp. WMMB 714]|nr:hypothetical protein H181DRAFT_00810 [Streptomyces sp. WMMB 714]
MLYGSAPCSGSARLGGNLPLPPDAAPAVRALIGAGPVPPLAGRAGRPSGELTGPSALRGADVPDASGSGSCPAGLSRGRPGAFGHDSADFSSMLTPLLFVQDKSPW